MISIEELENILRNKANGSSFCFGTSNESGVIQPWSEVARLCNSFKVKYHCDSTQLTGKEALENLNQCSFSVSSAHKFGGPKGIGWLVGENTSSLILGVSRRRGEVALKTILLYLPHVVHGNLMWKPRLIFLNYRNTEMTLKRE